MVCAPVSRVTGAAALQVSCGKLPSAAAGTTVRLFAGQLDHLRWLYVPPNGDVLVAKSNARDRPLRKELPGIKGWFMGLAMKRAGAATLGANRITLLRDADGDGTASTGFGNEQLASDQRHAEGRVQVLRGHGTKRFMVTGAVFFPMACCAVGGHAELAAAPGRRPPVSTSRPGAWP